jgi:4-carboxymuconolactone decarboxylase
MARLPDPIDTLSPEARGVYEKISSRRGAIRGPYAPLMHHPALALHVGDLGEYLRFNSTLPGDVRELAILITARAVSQPYEWIMHAPIARRAGLPDDVIERVRGRGDLSGLPAPYAVAARVVQHVLAHESIPQAVADSARGEFGVAGLLELVVLGGFYQMIAGVLFSFDVPLPEGEGAPF